MKRVNLGVLTCLLFFAGQSYYCSAQDTLLSVQTNMVLVKGGTFVMGCTKEQESNCMETERPAHKVTVSSFYIGKYDITQAQWDTVMGSSPSDFNGCPNCPIDNITWNDVQAFIEKLNALTGKKYRLPTEAEWEYAARGGVKSKGYKYSGGDILDSVAWYRDNSGNKTHEVGGLDPNELGLYDMTGNVWQWCADWGNEKYYAVSPAKDPKGPDSGTARIMRGGSWHDLSKNCLIGLRGWDAPEMHNNVVGFRVALDF